jgi:phosphoglucomutase/phosphomannomutase
LEADGFANIEIFAPHADPNGDFPNVPGHVSNPENPAVFDAIVERARETSADLILATDPDCDRMGCAAPLTCDSTGEWGTFTGNQLGALLTDFILQRRRDAGLLDSSSYIIQTLVTTLMIQRIAESYGVRTSGNLHVGFKWIGGEMDRLGPDQFVFGAEESHGYMVGTYVRDKDGAVACMLMAELAAASKAEGRSLHEKLDALFWQHGYHAEQMMSIFMAGSEGMNRMRALMVRFRQQPPPQLAGIAVPAVRDYDALTITAADGTKTPLDAPQGNMVILDLAESGNYVAVRPSGTEPKVKFYMFSYVPAELLADLERTKQEMSTRLNQIEADLSEFAEQV